MKFTKIRSYSSKLPIAHEFLTYMLFFVLPMPDKYLPLFIILWLVSWLLWRISGGEGSPVTGHKRVGFALFLGWFLLTVISIPFTSEPSLGLRLLEPRLVLVLMPLFLMLRQKRMDKGKIALYYILGSVAALAIYYTSFAYHYFVYDSITLRFQLRWIHLLHHFLDMKHPAYLSLNLALSFYLYVSSKKRTVNNLSLVIIYLLFGASIVVMQSRAGLLTFVLMSIFLLWEKQSFWKPQKSYLYITVLLLLCIGIVVLNPKFSSLGNTVEGEETIPTREILWQSSLSLIKEKPIFGYGLRGAKDLLVEDSFSRGLNQAKVRKYNAHNQFLQLVLDNGIFGLFLFLAGILLLVKSSSNKAESLKLFLLLFVAFMTESMLERIAGAALMSAMLCFITVNNSESKKCINATRISLVVWITVFAFMISVSILLYSMFYKIDGIKPDSYAVGNYDIVPYEELPGDVPEALDGIGAVSYDSSMKGWDGAFGIYYHVPIAYKYVGSQDTVDFSVYCFVSDDFDGTWARLSVDGNNDGKTAAYYDQNRKGTWQYLSLQSVCSKGGVGLNLMISSYDSESFDSLSGRVLFANPVYTVSELNYTY